MSIFDPRDMTDFDLDDYISDRLGTAGHELGQTDRMLLAAVHEEWKSRHPGTLPPCFSQVSFPDCYTGPRDIYRWHEA